MGNLAETAADESIYEPIAMQVPGQPNPLFSALSSLLQPSQGPQARPQQPDSQTFVAGLASRPEAAAEHPTAFRRPLPDLDAETLAQMRVPRGTFLDIQV